MTTRTQEIREWAANYVENEAEEMLFELDREEKGELVQQAREGVADATEDFYVNLLSSGSLMMSEEDVREAVEDDPELNAVKSEVASEVTVSTLAEKQGDVYRKTTQEWVRDEFPDEMTVEASDFPARQRYDDHIDNMLEVTFEEGVEAAKDHEVLYDAIRQEHPTEDNYRSFYRERQEETISVIKEQLSQVAEQMGVNPESMEEAVDQYEEDLMEAFDYVQDDLRDRWVERVYGESAA